MYPLITLIAYLIDKFFGEFSWIRHPVVVMGDYIKWFEKKFYADTIWRGVMLTLSLVSLVFIVIYSFSSILLSNILGLESWIIALIFGVVASTSIASNMLYSSVKDIISNPKNIKYLVSRDTQDLSHGDINKASIETYAENLSDGVIAPLFFLFLFGLEGAFVYKAINTLDSMVGYRNEKYENFGKFSAILDDMFNYIPSRITAVLIAIIFLSKKSLLNFYSFGKKHDSPNAGHPISAMALALDIKLGGDTVYFGKIKSKPNFGDGRESIETEDVYRALSLKKWLDIFIIAILLGAVFL